MFENEIYDFDMNATYLVPMSKLTSPECEEEVVECYLVQGGHPVEMAIKRDGYRTKHMYKKYFEYLVQTGYANKVKSEAQE